MKKVLSWNNCQGRRASLEAEDGCIKWLVSFTIPLAFSGLSYFAVKEGVLYSPPGQANPTKVALDPFPIEYQRYRSSQACPPLACLLFWVLFCSLSEISAQNPKGLAPCLEPCGGCHLSTAHPDAPGETSWHLHGEDRAFGETLQ